MNADVLICGGIGGGAQTALAAAGIKLFGGVSGDADEAVEAFINETLDYNPDVKCSHHEHNHGEGHTCGEHGCGSHRLSLRRMSFRRKRKPLITAFACHGMQSTPELSEIFAKSNYAQKI